MISDFVAKMNKGFSLLSMVKDINGSENKSTYNTTKQMESNLNTTTMLESSTLSTTSSDSTLFYSTSTSSEPTIYILKPRSQRKKLKSNNDVTHTTISYNTNSVKPILKDVYQNKCYQRNKALDGAGDTAQQNYIELQESSTDCNESYDETNTTMEDLSWNSHDHTFQSTQSRRVIDSTSVKVGVKGDKNESEIKPDLCCAFVQTENEDKSNKAIQVKIDNSNKNELELNAIDSKNQQGCYSEKRSRPQLNSKPFSEPQESFCKCFLSRLLGTNGITTFIKKRVIDIPSFFGLKDDLECTSNNSNVENSLQCLRKNVETQCVTTNVRNKSVYVIEKQSKGTNSYIKRKDVSTKQSTEGQINKIHKLFKNTETQVSCNCDCRTKLVHSESCFFFDKLSTLLSSQSCLKSAKPIDYSHKQLSTNFIDSSLKIFSSNLTDASGKSFPLHSIYSPIRSSLLQCNQAKLKTQIETATSTGNQCKQNNNTIFEKLCCLAAKIQDICRVSNNTQKNIDSKIDNNSPCLISDNLNSDNSSKQVDTQLNLALICNEKVIKVLPLTIKQENSKSNTCSQLKGTLAKQPLKRTENKKRLQNRYTNPNIVNVTSHTEKVSNRSDTRTEKCITNNKEHVSKRHKQNSIITNYSYRSSATCNVQLNHARKKNHYCSYKKSNCYIYNTVKTESKVYKSSKNVNQSVCFFETCLPVKENCYKIAKRIDRKPNLQVYNTGPYGVNIYKKNKCSNENSNRNKINELIKFDASARVTCGSILRRTYSRTLS